MGWLLEISLILEESVRRRFFAHLLRILVLISAGTIGFVLIEHWRVLDALYMTVMTVTTVGYGEPHPLSDVGQAFTIVLMLTGVGVALYILSDIVDMLLQVNPAALMGRRRMIEKIAKLSGHQILCGYGRTGEEVANHFVQNKVPFVVIEHDTTRAIKAREEGLLVLQADATTDEALLQAQIGKAKGIICALPDDTLNTFIALSARELNERISIVSRSANPGSEAKLKRAGAHMVISPYVIGGRRMATAVTHPLVTEFLDVVMHSPAYDLRMEQVPVMEGSPLIGETLRDANIKQSSGAMILALKRSGKLITNPLPDLVFQAGDELIALGTDGELGKLKGLVSLRDKG